MNNNEISKNDISHNLPKILIVISVCTLLTPFILYLLFLCLRLFPAAPELGNSEWLGFIGSYVGGCIGGIATLLAVYYTIKQSTEANKISFQQNNDVNMKNIQRQIDFEEARLIEMRIDKLRNQLSKNLKFLIGTQYGKIPVIDFRNKNSIDYIIQSYHELLFDLCTAITDSQMLFITYESKNTMIKDYSNKWYEIMNKYKDEILNIIGMCHNLKINYEFMDKVTIEEQTKYKEENENSYKKIHECVMNLIGFSKDYDQIHYQSLKIVFKEEEIRRSFLYK